MALLEATVVFVVNSVVAVDIAVLVVFDIVVLVFALLVVTKYSFVK